MSKNKQKCPLSLEATNVALRFVVYQNIWAFFAVSWIFPLGSASYWMSIMVLVVMCVLSFCFAWFGYKNDNAFYPKMKRLCYVLIPLQLLSLVCIVYLPYRLIVSFIVFCMIWLCTLFYKIFVYPKS